MYELIWISFWNSYYSMQHSMGQDDHLMQWPRLCYGNKDTFFIELKQAITQRRLYVFQKFFHHSLSLIETFHLIYDLSILEEGKKMVSHSYFYKMINSQLTKIWQYICPACTAETHRQYTDSLFSTQTNGKCSRCVFSQAPGVRNLGNTCQWAYGVFKEVNGIAQ